MRKKEMRQDTHQRNEDQIIQTYIPYNCDATKSPHIKKTQMASLFTRQLHCFENVN